MLQVEGLSSPGRFNDIRMTLEAGEIVGFAGLVGAGRTELACALTGLDTSVTGRIYLQGEEVKIGSPGQALRLGLGMVPEDRKRQGLIPLLSARTNITLPILNRLATLGWLRQQEERDLARSYCERLQVNPCDPEFPAFGMSGGNQQKLMLARWLAAKCRVLILDEPTRGVDVGAKAEIHRLILELAQAGHGILLISGELPELLHLSSRVLVMREGCIVGMLRRSAATQEQILRLMMGTA